MKGIIDFSELPPRSGIPAYLDVAVNRELIAWYIADAISRELGPDGNLIGERIIVLSEQVDCVANICDIRYLADSTSFEQPRESAWAEVARGALKTLSAYIPHARDATKNRLFGEHRQEYQAEIFETMLEKREAGVFGIYAEEEPLPLQVAREYYLRGQSNPGNYPLN